MIKDTVRIERAALTDDGRASVEVFLENDFGSERLEFCLLYELWADLDLSIGDIDKESLSQIEHADRVSAAYFSACASFAFSPSSLRSLYRKLVTKGFEKNVAQEAIELVRERGFVDEAELALRRAELCVEKRWGPARIYAQLREDGFPESAISYAQEYISRIDFAEICATFIEKKYGEIPGERHAREKMYAALLRYGYSASQIKQAISLLSRES